MQPSHSDGSDLAVRSILLESARDWPALGKVLDGFLPETKIPEARLPLSACQAVGGDPRQCSQVAAALLALGICLRILDDLEDQDRDGALWQQVGEARAWNYASAIHALCHKLLGEARLGLALRAKLQLRFVNSFLELTRGQDRDLQGGELSIEEHWHMVQRKSGTAYALACVVGAMVGTDEDRLVKACEEFGYHLGTAIQILNDMDSIWSPKGRSDLEQGKVTLPVLYGLQLEHDRREELQKIVATGRVAADHREVRSILDAIDTRAFLGWAALQERERGIAALSICPDCQGVADLEAFMTGMFGDLERFPCVL